MQEEYNSLVESLVESLGQPVVYNGSDFSCSFSVPSNGTRQADAKASDTLVSLELQVETILHSRS